MSRPVRPSVTKLRDGLPNPWMTTWRLPGPFMAEARYFASHYVALQYANYVAQKVRRYRVLSAEETAAMYPHMPDYRREPRP